MFTPIDNGSRVSIGDWSIRSCRIMVRVVGPVRWKIAAFATDIDLCGRIGDLFFDEWKEGDVHVLQELSGW